MYEDNYQVFDDPFRFTPDEHKPYKHHSYLSGVAFLQHVLDHSRKVLILIYGVTGVGKSTLVNDIIRRQDPSRVLPASIKASNVNSHGVIASIASSFGLSESGSEEALMRELHEYLVDKSSQNLYSLFVIDSAHELSSESLNRLGQLVRLIWDNRYKMKIFLIGSPVLDQLLYHSKNEVLQKKVLIGWNQHGMGETEVKGYVAHRIHNVGGIKLKFEDIVWRTLYDFSDGIPRRINRICNKLLLNGSIDNKQSFSNADILDAVRQLDNEGLLEVKKSFAALHGLKGMSNAYLEEAQELQVNQFTIGFTHPLLIEEYLTTQDDDDDANEDDDHHAEQKPESVPVPDPDRTRPVKKGTINDRFTAVPELKIPVDIRSQNHNSAPAFGHSSSRSRSKPIIFSVLAIVGIVLMISILSIDSADEPTTTAATTQPSASTTATIQTAESDNKGIITENLPDIPTPAVASEAEEAEPVIEEKPQPTETSQPVIEDTPPVVEDEIDETGYVEEQNRLAREKALAASQQATNEDSELDKKPEQAAIEDVVRVPRYSIRELKSMLMQGFWTRSGRPSVLLPSELNRCTETSKDIFCRATEIMKQANNKTITSRTGAMFHQFNSDGTFNVSYRRSAGIESGQISTANDLTEYKMTCHFVNKSQVECNKDGQLIQFVRRFDLNN